MNKQTRRKSLTRTLWGTDWCKWILQGCCMISIEQMHAPLCACMCSTLCSCATRAAWRPPSHVEDLILANIGTVDEELSIVAVRKACPSLVRWDAHFMLSCSWPRSHNPESSIRTKSISTPSTAACPTTMVLLACWSEAHSIQAPRSVDHRNLSAPAAESQMKMPICCSCSQSHQMMHPTLTHFLQGPWGPWQSMSSF